MRKITIVYVVLTALLVMLAPNIMAEAADPALPGLLGGTEITDASGTAKFLAAMFRLAIYVIIIAAVIGSIVNIIYHIFEQKKGQAANIGMAVIIAIVVIGVCVFLGTYGLELTDKLATVLAPAAT